jgi:predicted nucleic acid-binding protein
MTRVFADTFFFLAVLNRRDPSHEAALRFYGDDSMHFVTTEWVLGEVANASSAPAMRAGFKRLFDLVERDTRVREVRHLPNTFAMERPYRYG